VRADLAAWFDAIKRVQTLAEAELLLGQDLLVEQRSLA
jgi:hypothetical protein